MMGVAGTIDLVASGRGWPIEGSRSSRADTDPFRRVYDASVSRVYGYLLARCGSRSLAQDLTQEVFIVAARAFDDGRDIEVGWLIGVARNKLLESARRSRREARRIERAVDRRALDGSARASSDLSSDAALAALACLPPLHRAALTLRYLDDLPVPDVARALGKSVHATESLLVRARAAFRDHYATGLTDD